MLMLTLNSLKKWGITVVLSREGTEMQPDSCVAPAIRSAAAARMLSVFRWYCMNVPPQCTIGIYV